jgi:hydroxymethylbilane synthase
MLAINGNCTTPVAAFGVRRGAELHLRAFLAEPDGSRPRSVETTVAFPASAEAAAQIGHRLGAELI